MCANIVHFWSILFKLLLKITIQKISPYNYHFEWSIAVAMLNIVHVWCTSHIFLDKVQRWAFVRRRKKWFLSQFELEILLFSCIIKTNQSIKMMSIYNLETSHLYINHIILNWSIAWYTNQWHQQNKEPDSFKIITSILIMVSEKINIII